MAKPGLPARIAAADILHAVIKDEMPLSEVREQAATVLSDLRPEERARAFSIAQIVLRNLPALDAVIETFVDRVPPMPVMTILRICAAELLLEDISAHAAVDSAVTAVKANRKVAQLAGLTNAVCRKIVSQGADILAQQNAPELPSMLRGPMSKAFGKPAVKAMEIAFLSSPPVDFTIKDPKRVKEFATTFEGQVLPNGSVRVAQPGQITALPGFEEGDWWIQDAAATVPVLAMGDIKGKSVVDMCAAPGGKTMQLAALGAKVTAVDSSASRMERLHENVTRVGLSVNEVVADAVFWHPEEPIDAILLDAPCSATGTIRRHPDLIYVKSDWDLRPLLDIQRQMIQHSINILPVGGELIFSTCSLMPQEGEMQISALMASRKDVSIVPLKAADYGLPKTAQNKDGTLRLRPDFWENLGGMDGFFIARLVKLGN
jgi:16S rRNA (cytosine967-C5)-methyltransferase